MTASVDSAERPQVKRLAKSNSTETQPPSPLTDLDQSPVTQLQAPLPDSAGKLSVMVTVTVHVQFYSIVCLLLCVLRQCFFCSFFFTLQSFLGNRK